MEVWLFMVGFPPVPVKIYLRIGDSTEFLDLCDLLLDFDLDLDLLLLILFIGFGVHLFGDTCCSTGGYLI